MKRTCIILGVLAMFLCQNVSHAQQGMQRKIVSPELWSSVEYRSWKRDMGDTTQTISQFSFPMVLKLPLTRNLAFDMIGSTALSSAGDGSLSGIRDVKTRVVAMLADDTIMFTAGMNLPSGKSELDSEETVVSSLLSDKAMGFRYNRLGEGLDISVGAGTAKSFGPLVLGAGVGYLLKGEYEYLEAENSKYNPGDQINATGGMDLLLDPLLLRTDLTYTIHQSDTIDNSKVFKEAAKVSIQENAVLLMERLAVLLSARYLIRGESDILQAGVHGRTEKVHGDRIDVGGSLNLRLTKPMNLKLVAESTFIGENAAGQNDAAVFGFGAGMTLRFMRASYLDIMGKYHTGKSNNDEVTLTGFSTTASLKLVL